MNINDYGLPNNHQHQHQYQHSTNFHVICYKSMDQRAVVVFFHFSDYIHVLSTYKNPSFWYLIILYCSSYLIFHHLLLFIIPFCFQALPSGQFMLRVMLYHQLFSLEIFLWSGQSKRCWLVNPSSYVSCISGLRNELTVECDN